MRALLLAALLGLLAACSPDAKRGDGLRIVLQDPAKAGAEATRSLMSALGMVESSSVSALALSTPSTIGDFNCFALNITGTGILPIVSLQGCTIGDNFAGKGPGIIVDPRPRGTVYELSIPAGNGRNIDVFGTYPAGSDCQGSGSDGQGAYLVGRKTVDLLEDSTVTIPISYGGAAANFVCTGSDSGGGGGGGSGGGVQVQQIDPPKGTTSGGRTVYIHGGGYVAGQTSVAIGGVACAPVSVTNSNSLSCVTGARSAGFGDVLISVAGVGTNNLPGAYEYITSGYLFIFGGPGGPDLNFGTVSSASSADVTVGVENSGGSEVGIDSTTNYTISGSAFTFKGGVAPGTGGTCPSSPVSPIGPGGTCTVVLRFTPSSGPLGETITGTLSISHSAGSATRGLRGVRGS